MRVAVIGLGKAGRQHAAAVRQSGDAEVVAVADPAPAGAAAAEELGVRCWADYVEMLDAVEVDAVIVSLPHAALPAAARAAAERGRHVLLEKPMAATAAEARQVEAICREAGVRLMVNFVHRFRAEYRQAQAAIAAGVIGRPVVVTETMIAGRSELPGWVWDRAVSGGGMMMYNGVHSLDRLAWLAGSPIASVAARMGTFGHPTDLEDTAVATFTFQNGALGSLVLQKSVAAATLDGWQTAVHGTRGGLRVESGKGLDLVSDKERFSLQTGEDDRFLGAVREFLRAIREGREPSPSGEDGVAAIATVEALYASATGGGTVAVAVAVAEGG